MQHVTSQLAVLLLTYQADTQHYNNELHKKYIYSDSEPGDELIKQNVYTMT